MSLGNVHLFKLLCTGLAAHPSVRECGEGSRETGGERERERENENANENENENENANANANENKNENENENERMRIFTQIHHMQHNC